MSFGLTPASICKTLFSGTISARSAASLTICPIFLEFTLLTTPEIGDLIYENSKRLLACSNLFEPQLVLIFRPII